MIPKKNLPKWHQFRGYSESKWSLIILFCPAVYCVQHYTVSNTLLCLAHFVSNKILCPHLAKGLFVHLSHVNVLMSYHAALAKQLSCIKVVRVKKMWFCSRWEICIFHPNLMGFFALVSSQWVLSVVCQQVFSTSYYFWAKRGQNGGNSISFYMEKLYFSPDFYVFFPQIIPYKRWNKGYNNLK